MIIRTTLTIEVDPSIWRAIYGGPHNQNEAGLRRDVRKYVEYAIAHGAAGDEGAIKSVKASS
jgi:hypothetical protein